MYRDAAMVTPDGMPLVWLSRRRGRPEVSRVYGPDLMLSCCDSFRDRGARHYFYGGAEGVPEQLASSLTERFPGLEVAGGFSPPYRDLTEAENREIVARINESRPDFVWVGLGCPKQDFWMAEHRDELEAPVLVGVGAAFDFHSGRKRQAPSWMQSRGLEWLFRLLSEPRRLAGRYVAGNSRFIALVLAEELRLRR
ncbi:MAG: WecB/TagA/CpsF family glycosyltransferase [Gemmatimonadota bacterium]